MIMKFPHKIVVQACGETSYSSSVNLFFVFFNRRQVQQCQRKLRLEIEPIVGDLL